MTQGRIAQIESGIGTNRVTFDTLLHILSVLGYEFRIVSKKAALKMGKHQSYLFAKYYRSPLSHVPTDFLT